MKVEIILNEHTPEVESFPTEYIIGHYAEELKAFYNFAKEQSSAVGLSANQVSIDGKRLNINVFAIKVSRKHWGLIINPEIIEYFGKPVIKHEGCLTWPNKTIVAKRYCKIKVCYHTWNGNRSEGVKEAYSAQIWQHEIDHLRGNKEKVVDPVNFFSDILGRNEPCSCGSGKKYKKCCLKA